MWSMRKFQHFWARGLWRHWEVALESLGADIPLEMSPVGHYLLNVVDFPESHGSGMSITRNSGSANCVVSDKHMIRQNVFVFVDVAPMTKMHPAREGGPSLTLPYLEMKQFETSGLHPGGEFLPPLRLGGLSPEPKTIVSQVPSVQEPVDKCNALPIHTALTSTALGDALHGAKTDPKEIVRRLHVNWGHASAQQLKRTMAEADDKAGILIPPVDDVVRECEIWRASDAAPTIPIAGTSQASSFHEKVKVDLLFLGDLIALRVIGLFSR